MRIDPKGTIAGKPALLVRDCLRNLRARISWNVADLEAAASLEPGSGKSLLRALSAAGLIKSIGRGWWEITQAGQTLSSATAATPITRATAEKALREFLGRVERVNRDRYFLGRVNRVVLPVSGDARAENPTVMLRLPTEAEISIPRLPPLDAAIQRFVETNFCEVARGSEHWNGVRVRVRASVISDGIDHTALADAKCRAYRIVPRISEQASQREDVQQFRRSLFLDAPRGTAFKQVSAIFSGRFIWDGKLRVLQIDRIEDLTVKNQEQ